MRAIKAIDLTGWNDINRARLMYDEFGVVTAFFRPGIQIHGLSLDTYTRVTQLPSQRYMKKYSEG